MTKYYVGNIAPSEDTIFVFGSNPEGRHGSGSAKCAIEKFGAIYGCGEGLQGQCYALPTKDLRVKENNALRSIPREKIIENIKKMYKCALEHPDKKFKIAYRNTDEVTLNGYSGYEMIDMFLESGEMPPNVYVSEEWHNTGLFGQDGNQISLF
jgi:hypothetical protein